MTELKEKLQNLQSDSEFLGRAKQVHGYEELSRLLGEYDIEVSPQELHQIKEYWDTNKNELDEEHLDHVNGGITLLGAICAGGIGWCLGSFVVGLIDGILH